MTTPTNDRDEIRRRLDAAGWVNPPEELDDLADRLAAAGPPTVIPVEFTDGSTGTLTIPDEDALQAEFDFKMGLLDSMLPGGFGIPEATTEDYLANGLTPPTDVER